MNCPTTRLDYPYLNRPCLSHRYPLSPREPDVPRMLGGSCASPDSTARVPLNPRDPCPGVGCPPVAR
ncbi:unnamed protein product, partial [Staurois parvus]